MKVLNYGSLNIDYVYDVAHIVVPGETIHSTGRTIFPGGKGLNQSIAMARAGLDVFHAGLIGPEGNLLKNLLEDAHVDTRFVQQCDQMNGHTIIQVDENGQNCIIVYGGTNQMLTRSGIDETLRSFSKGDYLVLQNETNEIDYLLRSAHEKGMLTVLNPSPIDASILALPLELVDLFVVNEIEGAQIAGCTQVDDIIVSIARQYANAKILLTLGGDGSIYFDGTEKHLCPAQRVDVVDTTAAGDTFLGYFLYGILNGNHIADTMRLASCAAALAVSQKGAASSIPTLSQVRSRLG